MTNETTIAFKERMIELKTASDKELFLTNNRAQIETALEGEGNANWLAEQADILQLMLSKPVGVDIAATNANLSNAIFKSTTAYDVWKAIPDIFLSWSRYEVGMLAMAEYSLPLKDFAEAVKNTSGLIGALTESSYAIGILNIIANTAYSTVKKSWAKNWSKKFNNSVTSAITAPSVAGLVFATIGHNMVTVDPLVDNSIFRHKNNKIAYEGKGRYYSNLTGISNADSLSFDGAKIDRQI